MKTKSTRNTRTVRRSMDDTPVDGNLLSIDTPKFISIVGRPANQRPFVAIRSEPESTPAAPTRTVRAKRTLRSDQAIMMLTFPATYTEDQALGAVQNFGLDDYNVTFNGTNYVAVRSDTDLQSVAKSSSQIRLTSDGVMASLSAESYTPVEATPEPSVSLARLEFAAKTFDAEGVAAWAAKNSVDIPQDGIQNSGELMVVQRKDVPEGTEVRRMEIEKGVVAVVVRSDVMDVPVCLAIGVIETAYGCWGWGQMDFNASMADIAFCDAFDNAQYRLGEVMRRIVYHSELPLETRKTLVKTAAEQFATFVTNAIDALPRQVLLLAVRSDADTKGATKMSTEELKRQEAEAKAAKEKAELDAQPITRADIKALIAETLAAVAPPVVAVDTAEVVRADTPAVTAPATTPADPAVAPVIAQETQVITRADLNSALADALKPMLERVERAEQVTIVRDTSGDPAVSPAAKSNIFRGSIFPVAQQ